MHLVELAISDEQTVQIESTIDLRDKLTALGAKELKPNVWFFHGDAKKQLVRLMKDLAELNTFTLLQS